MGKRFTMKKLAIGLPLVLMAAGLVAVTAGWAGYGRHYTPRYNYSNDYLSNWSTVDARAVVDNVVIADTSGLVAGWNKPVFNMFIDQQTDIDIDTDITQRNSDDDCGCTSRKGRYDTDRMSNWSDLVARANVSNAVIADTSGLVAGNNTPRFNLYVDQHTDIDIDTDLYQGNYN